MAISLNFYMQKFYSQLYESVQYIMHPTRLMLAERATTKKRYSDTTIQRYRNRNLEPEPGTVHKLCKLEHFAPQGVAIQ
jgi:hypothetical protein